MKLILKKDVQNLGEVGDVVEVKDGYARNFLLPQNVAEIATKGALENREQNIARIKAKAQKLHDEAQEKANTIEALGAVTIEAKAGESGKLFGAITTKKLAEIIKEKVDIEVDRRSITLSAPLNKIGEETMNIKLTSKVTATLSVDVVASEILKEELAEEEIIGEETDEAPVEEVSEESAE